MSNNYFNAAIVLAAILIPLPCVAGQAEAKKIARALDSRDDGFRDSSAELVMTITNASGDATQRKLQVKTLEVLNDGNRSLLSFSFPADIRGTALLSHSKFGDDDDQWLYMPAIKRIKRISSRNKSGAFVGSEFSFEDLTDKYIEDYTYQEFGIEPCSFSTDINGVISTVKSKCFVLERKPKNKFSGYSKELLRFDTESYRIVTVEYYDIRGELLKLFTAERFRIFKERYWRPMFSKMENKQTGKSTTLEYQSIQFGVGLQENDLSRTSLGR